jgi:hypothetical protein
MSEYDYDDRPRRRSHRTRDRSPEYVSETTYIQRGVGQPSRDLVFRGREDSIEEIDRDFPPPNSDRRSRDYPPRGSRSSRGAPRSDYYDDDYYSDAGPAAAGAAAYGAGRYSRPRPRRGRDDDDYYSEDNERPRRDRRKSRIEEAAEGLGLGGVVAAVMGNQRSRSKSRRRGSSRAGSSDRDTHRTSSQERRKKWQQAAKAAVLTGVVEAVRSRNEPGGWTGDKGKRVATAALGAAAADGFLDRNPDEKSKRHIIESMVGGLAANHLANGSRNRSGSRGRSASRSRSRGPAGFLSRSRSRLRSLSRGGRGRSRSDSPGGRSHSRGRGLKEVAALGGIAAAGKAIYDRVRSKSRGRGKRSPSASSEDSYVPARRQRYQGDRDRGPPQDDDIDDRRGRSERGGEDGGGGDMDRKRDSSSDSVSTTDLENQRKKTRVPVQAGYGPTAYADGNPYAAVGNLPPPPMGGNPPPQRY